MLVASFINNTDYILGEKSWPL